MTAEHSGPQHRMWSTSPGGGWTAIGMAQLFPVITFGTLDTGRGPFDDAAWYLTQPALMVNLESPAHRLVLRTTLNFEGLTQEDGELTAGAWGEGFLDKRHPHTLLHELMLSANFDDVAGGEASLSLGKGFAPFGTDDPMARPGLKYPTNHHLSQILERWTLNAVFLRDGWGAELGIFGGTEPEDPYDFSNVESFPDSWSARLSRRWGAGRGPMAEWEATVSYGDVAEEHDGELERTRLWNVALRHAGTIRSAGIYGLLEASQSSPEDYDGFFSILGEARLDVRGHQPYARLEYAIRPEYPRDGAPGTDAFFRYDHDAHPVGATRWLITTIAYAYQATDFPLGIRPLFEAQHHRAHEERGGIDPEELFGTDSLWSFTVGARIFLGGGPMRMGSYGQLDPMTAMMRRAGRGP